MGIPQIIISIWKIIIHPWNGPDQSFSENRGYKPTNITRGNIVPTIEHTYA
jgi:hypothetical protein